MSLQPCALLALKSLLYGKLYFFNFEVSSAAFLAVSSALHFATSCLPLFSLSQSSQQCMLVMFLFVSR